MLTYKKNTILNNYFYFHRDIKSKYKLEGKFLSFLDEPIKEVDENGEESFLLAIMLDNLPRKKDRKTIRYRRREIKKKRAEKFLKKHTKKSKKCKYKSHRKTRHKGEYLTYEQYMEKKYIKGWVIDE